MLKVDQVIGTYRVVSQLGGGGCATVWRARHIHLESDHALKVLREELVSRSDLRWRFLDEGRVQAQLRHPGIVRVTDIVVEPGLAGLVMDFIEGPSLTQLLAERGGQGLSRGEVLAIASGLFDALHFAHEHGVVHRDIKPGNLVLTKDHRGRLQPVLLDFGLARVRGTLRSERSGDTQMQLKMGTPVGEIMFKGRWECLKTVCIYLQEGAAAMAASRIAFNSLSTIRELADLAPVLMEVQQ